MKLNTTIITKKLTIILPVLLIVTAAVFRLWRINELTEFLGDQGRTGLVIYNAWKTKTVPLVGPTVLSGQYLGPFFYYLIGPAFIIGRFNPVAPSIFMALLGIFSVYFLFRVASRLWGLWIGWASAMLFAVGAYHLQADRTIWEPTVIPLFMLLYLWCIYSLVDKRRYWHLLPMGAIVGILIQLHYPNMFFVGLSIVVLLYLLVTKRTHKKTVILWFLAGIAGFLLILSPFLWYEAQHGWVDLREIANIFISGGTGGPSTYSYTERLIDASFKLFGYLAPKAPRLFILFLQLFVFFAVFLRRTFWSIFFMGWYLLGIAMIGFYRGVVFDHYLFFLLPLPYLLLGHAAWSLRTYIPTFVIVCAIGWLAVINVRNTDILSFGPNDISRARGIVEEVRMSAKNQPFSFTLTSSRSFSDLHYRYFFKLAGLEPKPITDTAYGTLFLVCDQRPCPTRDQMRQKSRVEAMCFEPHCKGPYPTVDLSSWELVATYYIPEGWVYMFLSSGVRE